MKQYLSFSQRIDYQDMIDRNAADNEVVEAEEIKQIEYENITEHIPAKPNTDDFELFVFDGKCKVSGLMSVIDHKLPPASVLERGSEAIRTYWNSKNLRKRKT